MEKRIAKITAGVLFALVLSMSMLLCASAEGTEDVAGGIYEEVPWRITSDYELIIGQEGEVTTFTNAQIRKADSYPWYEYRSLIKSCRFAGRVNACT